MNLQSMQRVLLIMAHQLALTFLLMPDSVNWKPADAYAAFSRVICAVTSASLARKVPSAPHAPGG